MVLFTIFTLNIIALLVLLFVSNNYIYLVKRLSIFFSGLILLLSIFLFLKFKATTFFQYLFSFHVNLFYFNLDFFFGLDGISVYFFLLTSLLTFLCILFVWNEESFKNYTIFLLFIQLFLFFIFSILNLFLFYIFFEALLIPMFLKIGLWGSRERKIRAAYLLFFYTVVGSLLMLLGIIYIFKTIGTTNFEYLFAYNFSFTEQYWLWLAFFLSFAAKIPMFPFHIWLPEAHVEAPTVGSVLLAGILLKLGVYGFLRFNLVLFPEASLFFSPFIYLLSVLGIIFASLSAIRQTDLKRIVAYSSIAHMNLVTLGIFSFNLVGIEGAIFQSLSHGFVASALFFIIGILYNRYHSRVLFYFSGLVQTMPLFSIFFLIFTMANIALPGTSSFIGEFLLLCGIFETNFVIGILSSIGVILCGSYSLWLLNRTLFGNLKINYTSSFKDLNSIEFSILSPLVFFVFLLGLYPSYFTDFIDISAINLL